MAFFVGRLRAPRPSFPFDMSDGERSLMAEHAAYWQDHADRGTAVVFGPVADPAGAWGLVVIEADDERSARSLTMNDPVIKAAAGFAYELLPMMSAVTRATARRP